MKIAPYVQKLNNSNEFKQFIKEYDNAFMIAGFFVLDYESGQNQHQIDFYVPSEKKIAAFNLDGKVNVRLLEMMNEKVPEKLDIQTKIDLDALQGILQDEMKNRNMTEDIKKVIAILQNIKGKKVWNISCVLSGMEILKAHVEDETKTVLKMEKTSILDYVKKMPAAALSQMQKVDANQSPENLKEKLKQLDKLGQELQKEKEATEKALKSKDSKETKQKKVKK